MLSPVIRLGHQTGLIMSAPGPPSRAQCAPRTPPHYNIMCSARPVLHIAHGRARTLDGPPVNLKFITGPILILRMSGI